MWQRKRKVPEPRRYGLNSTSSVCKANIEVGFCIQPKVKIPGSAARETLSFFVRKGVSIPISFFLNSDLKKNQVVFIPRQERHQEFVVAALLA